MPNTDFKGRFIAAFLQDKTPCSPQDPQAQLITTEQIHDAIAPMTLVALDDINGLMDTYRFNIKMGDDGHPYWCYKQKIE